MKKQFSILVLFAVLSALIVQSCFLLPEEYYVTTSTLDAFFGEEELDTIIVGDIYESIDYVFRKMDDTVNIDIDVEEDFLRSRFGYTSGRIVTDSLTKELIRRYGEVVYNLFNKPLYPEFVAAVNKRGRSVIYGTYFDSQYYEYTSIYFVVEKKDLQKGIDIIKQRLAEISSTTGRTKIRVYKDNIEEVILYE